MVPWYECLEPPPTRRLNVIQRHDLRLLGKGAEIPAGMTSLEHWRDVSALAVCHKTHGGHA